MIRAFVALEVPAALRSQLAIQQFLVPMPRQVDPGQFHLTLAFLGEHPMPVLEAVHDGLCALRQAPFEIALVGMGLFGGNRPRAVWAGVAPSEPLARLQAKVERAARLAGLRPEARRFQPHVTLGRFPPPGIEEALRIERAVAAEQGFRAGPWRVEEVVLFESHLTRQGSHYHDLARYPLR